MLKKRTKGPEMNSIVWATLEDLQRRLTKLERVVDEGVPAYVAPMDREVRRLRERVAEVERASDR